MPEERFTSAFTSKVATKALEERESLTDLSARYEVHPKLISKSKQKYLELSTQEFKNQETPGEPDYNTRG